MRFIVIERFVYVTCIWFPKTKTIEKIHNYIISPKTSKNTVQQRHDIRLPTALICVLCAHARSRWYENKPPPRGVIIVYSSLCATHCVFYFWGHSFREIFVWFFSRRGHNMPYNSKGSHLRIFSWTNINVMQFLVWMFRGRRKVCTKHIINSIRIRALCNVYAFLILLQQTSVLSHVLLMRNLLPTHDAHEILKLWQNINMTWHPRSAAKMRRPLESSQPCSSFLLNRAFRGCACICTAELQIICVCVNMYFRYTYM